MAWIPNAGDLPWLNLFPRDPNGQAERQLSTRRQLLIRTLATGATVAAGAALASCAPSGAASGSAAQLPPPETTTLRITSPFACDPPLWLAKEFLVDEGFRDVLRNRTEILKRNACRYCFDLAELEAWLKAEGLT